MNDKIPKNFGKNGINTNSKGRPVSIKTLPRLFM